MRLSLAVRQAVRLRLLFVAALAQGCLASTCVVVEGGPEDVPYGEESNAQAMGEEEETEAIRDSDL